MRNFAEEVTYLYFRLNGFFLLNNYVTHTLEYDGSQNTDTDLIGIRPKHVSEIVGLLNPNDTHEPLRQLFQDADFVGLICEVKGGTSRDWTLNDQKLLPCVKRLGLIPNDVQLNQCVQELRNNRTYSLEVGELNYKFIKVIATDIKNHHSFQTWYHISLEQMINFIESRINLYTQKRGSWLYNDSALLQYLIYRERP